MFSPEPNLPSNMIGLRNGLQVFAQMLAKNPSGYIVGFFVFVYHILLHMDMPCGCEEQKATCWFYMILPACVITILTVWVDKCDKTTWTCKCFICELVKGLFYGLLWPTSVLLDGDWSVCCWNDGSVNQSVLACKKPGEVTTEDRHLIGMLKGKSWVSYIFLYWWFLLFTGTLLNWLLMVFNHSLCRWCLH